MDNDLEKDFREFMRRCLGGLDVPPIQAEAMRIAFFSGVGSVVKRLPYSVLAIALLHELEKGISQCKAERGFDVIPPTRIEGSNHASPLSQAP